MNLFALISSITMITNASGRDLNFYQNHSQNHSFTYDTNAPLVNGSYANRIATENFEYEHNTNLSTSVYPITQFSLMVKEFNDIDFQRTNNTYKSKYCEVKSITTSNLTYNYIKYINNDFRLRNIRVKEIVKPNDSTFTAFQFDSGSNYLQMYLDYANRRLRVINNTNTLLTKEYFIPVKSQYQYLYFCFDFIPILGSYYYNIYVVCYNQTSQIKLINQTYFNLDSYQNWKIDKVRIRQTFGAINKYMNIIALDINSITDRRFTSQKSYLNANYDSYYDLRKFYLTLVPFYTTEFSRTTVSTKYYYATTILYNRYLRYKTNASDYTTTSNDLFKESVNMALENSFSIKFELGTNMSSGVGSLKFYFNKSDYYFGFANVYLGGIWYKYFSLNDTEIPYTLNLDDRIIVHAQFKNKIMYLALYVNDTIFTSESVIMDKFEYITCSGFRILNSEVKPLSVENVISYSNNQKILLFTEDFLTFKFRIYPISTAFAFLNIISINFPTIQTSIYDSNNVKYDLQYIKVLEMRCSVVRDSLDGKFILTNNNEFSVDLLTDRYNNSFLFNFLIDLSSGNLYLYANFQNPIKIQTTLNLQINFTRFLIYSDEIPENNLMINKALEILLPLMIFGLIIVGFYSNSNSKYMAFIGMYIGIFVFYLMEYMSLLFMILCFIIQSIGFYVIIKHEKSEGGI